MKKALLLGAAVLGIFANFSMAAEGWPTSYDDALKQAAAENRPVLINFTGSDWCGWCVRLDKETFSKPAFKDFAKNNLVLLELDFPQGKRQTPELKKQNNYLQSKFNVEGFPTLVLLDSKGKEIARNVGYLAGGPEGLESWVKQAEKK